MSFQASIRRARSLVVVVVAAAFAAPHAALAQTGSATPETKVVTPAFDFSGLFFGSFSYRTDSAAKLANGGKERSQFNIDRVYLTFRMPAGDDGSIRVTTDIFQQAGAAAAYYAGWVVRIKYAYFQYNFLHDIGGMKGFNAVARIGALHTVSVDHYELFWPRYLEQTGIERNGYFSSADVGVAALVTLPNKLGEVYATITNGPGYTSGETDRFKDYALRVSLTPFGAGDGIFKTFTISPWVYLGKTASAHQNDATPATNGPVSDGLNRNRYGILIGNRDRRLTFGVNYAQRTETFESGANSVASPLVTADTAGTLTDGFVIVRPFELMNGSKKSPFGVLARYDNFVPKSSSIAGVGGSAPSQQRTIAGIFWDLNSRATLALDYQALNFSNYTPAAQPARQETLFLHWNINF